MCIVFAESVGVLLFECDGHAGAPGTTGVASVCGTWSVRPCGWIANLPTDQDALRRRGEDITDFFGDDGHKLETGQRVWIMVGW